MKCVGCQKHITSGVLFYRPGATYAARGLDPETYRFTPIKRDNLARIVVFCDEKCVEDFFFHRDRFDKLQVPLSRRLISRAEVITQFQAGLFSDNEDQKDLVYILGQSVWR
jgi:hypothetical protein